MSAAQQLAVPVFVHASHLINLGSPSDETLESSIALLGHTLRRAADLGARGVVVHAGTSVSRGRRDAALAKLHDIVGRLLDEAHEGVQLLIEPTSGGGEALASTVDSTIEYLAVLDDDRVGVCLDTCHLHAAGEPMNTGAGVQQTMGKVAAAIGAERVGLIHVNDSRDAGGSRRDRHESLGSGQHRCGSIHRLVPQLPHWQVCRWSLKHPRTGRMSPSSNYDAH